MLSSLYPQYDWLPWKFEKCARYFWDDEKNQRKFLEWAGKQLKINEMSDWYKVTTKHISELGGGGLLRTRFRDSISLMLTEVYPDYKWLPWKFANTPNNWWKDNKNKKQFLDWVGGQLGIKDHNDWYNVTTQVLMVMSYC
jgi:hypothetical protein